MSKFKIKKLTKNDYPLWEQFLSESPQRTVFSTTDWLNAISPAFGGKTIIYGCFQNTNLVGGCGLIERKKIGMPFSVPKEMLMPYQPIILKNFDYKRNAKEISQTIQVVRAIAKTLSRDYKYISIIHHHSLTDVRPFLWENWDAQLRYNYVIPLTTPDQIYSGFRRNIRKQISKAERQNISIMESDNIELFYELVKKSFVKHDHQFPIPEEILFELFSELHSKNIAKLFMAKAEHRITSARIILCKFDTVHDWLAGADPEFLNSGATPLLIWQILKKHWENYNYFDFGGATYLPSIARFKNNFGGKLIPYYLTEKYSSTFFRSLIKFHQFIKS